MVGEVARRGDRAAAHATSACCERRATLTTAMAGSVSRHPLPCQRVAPGPEGPCVVPFVVAASGDRAQKVKATPRGDTEPAISDGPRATQGAVLPTIHRHESAVQGCTERRPRTPSPSTPAHTCRRLSARPWLEKHDGPPSLARRPAVLITGGTTRRARWTWGRSRTARLSGTGSLEGLNARH